VMPALPIREVLQILRRRGVAGTESIP